MVRSSYPLISLLALLSLASGYLMSKASWIGRVGITFFHKGYNLLKIWWQGSIAVFLMLMILLSVQQLIYRKLPTCAARSMNSLILVLVLAGLYLTYDDFHTDLSHRLLGHRFHYGCYLFWIGWMLICLFFIFKKKGLVSETEIERR